MTGKLGRSPSVDELGPTLLLLVRRGFLGGDFASLLFSVTILRLWLRSLRWLRGDLLLLDLWLLWDSPEDEDFTLLDPALDDAVLRELDDIAEALCRLELLRADDDMLDAVQPLFWPLKLIGASPRKPAIPASNELRPIAWLELDLVIRRAPVNSPIESGPG